MFQERYFVNDGDEKNWQICKKKKKRHKLLVPSELNRWDLLEIGAEGNFGVMRLFTELGNAREHPGLADFKCVWGSVEVSYCTWEILTGGPKINGMDWKENGRTVRWQ